MNYLVTLKNKVTGVTNEVEVKDAFNDEHAEFLAYQKLGSCTSPAVSVSCEPVLN